MGDKIAISREMELVLCSARPRMDGETAERISGLLEGPVDWGRVLSIAERHRVTALLYRNLRSSSEEKIPKEVLSELQRVYLLNARRNLLFTQDLLEIIGLLEDHGIKTVPFKGLTLAIQAYGDSTLRIFSDLDILVDKEDVLVAKDLLISKGYTPTMKLAPFQDRALLDRGDHYSLFHSKTGTYVEVHWSLLPLVYSVTFDDGLWDRLMKVSLDGASVRSLSSEDLILFLSVHATKHGWSHLMMVSDLAGLIEGEDIDWDFVGLKAGEMRIRRILHIGLLLSQKLFGTAIPEPIATEAARDKEALKFIAEISKSLFDESGPRRFIVKPLVWSRTREGASDRFRFYFRYLRILVTPSSLDYDLIDLPKPLSPLYWVVRPIRLFWVYGLKGGGDLLNKTEKR